MTNELRCALGVLIFASLASPASAFIPTASNIVPPLPHRTTQQSTTLKVGISFNNPVSRAVERIAAVTPSFEELSKTISSGASPASLFEIDPFTQLVIPTSNRETYVYYNLDYDPSQETEEDTEPVFVTSVAANRKRRLTNALLWTSSIAYVYWLITQILISTSTTIPSFGYLYKTHPIQASVLICGLKSILADFISQVKAQAPDVTWNPTGKTGFSLSKRQSLSYIIYGAFGLGLGTAIMYNKVMPAIFPNLGTGIMSIVAQTCFDNFLLAPLFWIPPAYIVKAWFFPRVSLDTIVAKNSGTYSTISYDNNNNNTYKKLINALAFIAANTKVGISNYIQDVRHKGLLFKYWSLWLPAQMLTFSPLIPTHFRSACTASISFLWLLILMNVGSGKKK